MIAGAGRTVGVPGAIPRVRVWGGGWGDGGCGRRGKDRDGIDIAGFDGDVVVPHIAAFIDVVKSAVRAAAKDLGAFAHYQRVHRRVVDHAGAVTAVGVYADMDDGDRWRGRRAGGGNCAAWCDARRGRGRWGSVTAAQGFKCLGNGCGNGRVSARGQRGLGQGGLNELFSAEGGGGVFAIEPLWPGLTVSFLTFIFVHSISVRSAVMYEQ